MNFLKAYATIVSIIGFSIMGFAQKATVKGEITDKESKESIPFVNVYTKDKAVGTTSDFDGNYEVSLEPGTHELIFSSLEYGKTTQTITVTSGETLTLDVELTTADIKMETILVKTDKYAKPIEDVISSMEIIKPNIIENKASTDVTSALEQAPGLTIVDNEPQLRAGSGYSFGAGSRVMILVDDLPLLSGDAGRPSWGFIPIENIEQIEVIKGASSVLYGSSALNGVINIRTSYPTSKPKTVINVNTGIWDKPRQEQAKWWGADQPFYTSISFLRSKKAKENFSYTLGGNVLLERGYLGPARLEEITPDNLAILQNTLTPEEYADTLQKISERVNPPGFTHRSRLNFTTRVRAKRNKGLTWGINGNFMYSRSTTILIWDNDTSGLLRSRPGATTVTRQPQLNVDPYIKYFDKRGNNFSLNTRIYYQNNDNDNNQQNSNTVFYGEFRYQKNFQSIPNFTISAGAMAQHVIGTSELFAGGSEGAVKRDQTNFAFYAQVDKKVWDRVNFTLGGRWEYFAEDTNRAHRPIFRAGTSARIAKATYIRASFGQGFRFPTISEKYINTDIGGFAIVPNPDLKPEDSWSAEIGIKQGIKIRKFLGYVDVAGFTNFYKNYVEFIAGIWGNSIADATLGFRSLNTGNARVSGIDVSIMGQGKFTEDFGISLLMGYTWAKPITLNPNLAYAENVFGGEITHNLSSSDTSDAILKYRYEHLVKADVELDYKNLSTGISFRLNSKMRNVDNVFLIFDGIGIGNINEFLARHDGPEYIFDWRISYNINESSKVSFIINNMLNREYAQRPLVINAPRSFILQYTLTL